MSVHDPLVAVVTPVYNCEKYFSDCIESILAQTYDNWEYTIVNNCSTDKTLEIAERYSKMDRRVRVCSYNEFVGLYENHNRALRLISPESKYCKVVAADDWIDSDCLTQMVRVAEAHPTVAIVGSYQQYGDKVIGEGLPPNLECFSGRAAIRLSLLSLGHPHTLDAFGVPTSSLYRSEVVRNNDPFFPHSAPYADTTLCYKYLHDYDFGFVHRVLSTMRAHDEQTTAKVNLKYGMSFIGSMDHISTYGPVYLDEVELETTEAGFFRKYYKCLGARLLQLHYDKEYWAYQASKMKEFGYPFHFSKVIRGAVEEIAEELQDPGIAFHKFFAVLQRKYCK
jgi:glycosyltransferase involved in cell wall biosynthesis